MKTIALALTWFVLVLGGCIPVPQPPQPPIEPPAPQHAVDRIETDMFIAERIWPSAERALTVSQTIIVTLRVTAKERLDYIFWREIIGGYAVEDVGSYSDLEFIALYLPKGATQEWQYDLTGYKVGVDTLDGVLKAVSGPRAIDARLKATVLVRKE